MNAQRCSTVIGHFIKSQFEGTNGRTVIVTRFVSIADLLYAALGRDNSIGITSSAPTVTIISSVAMTGS